MKRAKNFVAREETCRKMQPITRDVFTPMLAKAAKTGAKSRFLRAFLQIIGAITDFNPPLQLTLFDRNPYRQTDLRTAQHASQILQA